MKIALVGNKIDLLAVPKTADTHSSSRAVCPTLGKQIPTILPIDSFMKGLSVSPLQLASSSGILFFETSAETGENVEELFMALATEILDKVSLWTYELSIHST